ncbi:FAD-dependent oxidoreductase domain-containing protein 1 [Trichinella pseudospiralis]|uniref:FAD-dependent oxidoreductase domain-containing protein 1 n=1 Tax=Trichinella pseudospiralis TaxID=6337 RepID=A0A0V1IE79_TRIPS|nr:FAD-dependent oxidoreductase domain-containing protein 1 [Trichinella pseudospiralis]
MIVKCKSFSNTMHRMVKTTFHRIISSYPRTLHKSSILNYDDYTNKSFYDIGEHPYKRVWEITKLDFQRNRMRYNQAKYDYYKRRGKLTNMMKSVCDLELLPMECTVAIIGGGLVGSACAWWIKQRIRDDDMKVVVIEADSTFSISSTILSPGGIWQQFSCPEKVQMSLFTAEFLRNANEHLRILENELPAFRFTPMNSLFLADNEEKANAMVQNHKMQTDLGAKVKLLNNDELQLMFPFMRFGDILLGSLGSENEGVFDGWQLLSAFREKNITLGVQYIKAKVTGFLYEWNNDLSPARVLSEREQWKHKSLRRLVIEPQVTDCAPRAMYSYLFINCAGAWSGEVAEMAGFGLGEEIMSVPIPVVARKRYAFIFHCPDGPSLDMPYLFDPSGVWCRREGLGHLYMCGKNPSLEEDSQIDHSNLDVDYDYFDTKIWPVLAARVPSFEKLKVCSPSVKNAWAYYVDRNLYDNSAIIGPHPFHNNYYHCGGFDGMALQHAIPAARALMEQFLEGAYVSIDLRDFHLSRMLRGKTVKPECF